MRSGTGEGGEFTSVARTSRVLPEGPSAALRDSRASGALGVSERRRQAASVDQSDKRA